MDPYKNITVDYYDNVSPELYSDSYKKLVRGCEGGSGTITVTNWKWQEGDMDELRDCVLLAETGYDNGFWNPVVKKWIWENDLM